MGGQFKLRVDISSKHENVTGSCTEVTIHMPQEKVKFLIDCGLYQGEDDFETKNRAKFDFDPEEVEFVIVTHNHVDHIGRLPLLYRRGYEGKVHATRDTAKMLNLSLGDSEKVQKTNAEEYGLSTIYTRADVNKTLENVVPHEFEKWFEPYPGIKMVFFMNGHLVGAALTLIHICVEGYEPINILVTGDYKDKNMFFAVKELPKWVRELPLTIITESTYGYVDSKEASKPVFAKNVVEMLETKNLILVPVFSLARGQEILYTLKQMQTRGVLDKKIPIYMDGKLFIDYCNMYRYTLSIADDMREFYPQNVNHMNKDMRETIVKSHMKKIILTTSGMGNHGPAQEYIPKCIERSDTCIHFVGYTSPSTLGYHLINAKDIVEIGDAVKKKKCTVLTTGEFSTHAKRDELVSFYKQFTNIQALLIHHGEIKVKKQFANYCSKNLRNCKRIEILGDGNTVSINEWGVVKLIQER